jgi:hypothetical protein
MLALLAAPLVLAGCPDWTAYLGGECGSLVGMKGDPQLSRPACPGDDAGPDNGCVGGECVGVSAGWFGPTWLWVGPKEQAPPCEGESYYEGFADFTSAGLCEVCTCQPPTGTCALPSQLTASTKACNLPGGSSVSFDAPAAWDGQCDSSTQVPPGVAHSLTVAPLGMMENGCLPGPSIPAKVIPVEGATFGRACHGQGWSGCGDYTNSACIPDDAPRPAGFKLCAFHEGNQACLAYTSFTEQHVFYERAEVGCIECGCDPPVGSACTATLSVFKAGQCGSPPVVQGITISSVDQTCVDVMLPGQALGSKSAEAITYLPGACAPTGGQTDNVIAKIGASTFCCRP